MSKTETKVIIKLLKLIFSTIVQCTTILAAMYNDDVNIAIRNWDRLDKTKDQFDEISNNYLNK